MVQKQREGKDTKDSEVLISLGHGQVYMIWRDFLALGISAGMLMTGLVYESWCLSSTKQKCTPKKHSKKPAGPVNKMKEWLVLAEVAQRPPEVSKCGAESPTVLTSPYPRQREGHTHFQRSSPCFGPAAPSDL